MASRAPLDRPVPAPDAERARDLAGPREGGRPLERPVPPGTLRRPAGRSADTRGPAQQEVEEERGADDADDDADGDLVREADDPPEDVAHEDERGTEDRDPRQRAPQLVPHRHADDVRD